MGLEQTVDLLYKRKESILKKKDGVLTNGGFEKQNKTKKKTFSGLSESLTRFTMTLLRQFLNSPFEPGILAKNLKKRSVKK